VLALILEKAARRPRMRWLSVPITAYAEAIRITPLLIQLYLVYQIPVLNVPVPVLDCGIFVLTIPTAGYLSEIIRSGIESVDRGQFEVAKTGGMSERQALLHIIYPQAFANIVPKPLGQTAVLIKDRSILSFIAVFELRGAGLIFCPTGSCLSKRF